MGRGNVCTFGVAEGLYYVDYDFLDVYSKLVDEENNVWDFRMRNDVDEDGFEYDESESNWNRGEFELLFKIAVKSRFPSFRSVDKWISITRRAVLENKLFYIAMEDNEWSLAIELIKKGGEYDGEEKVGLQMGLYRNYLKGIEEILVEMNGEVGTYAGAWTHGTIRKDDLNEKI